MAYGIEPYENIFIGNFLFGLGLAIGARRPDRALACVNLLQQTPLDPLLGDVLLDLPGTMRLFEFKRSTNKADKELLKAKNLRTALTRASAAVQAVSRDVHWLARSVPAGAGADVPVSLLPYVDFGMSEAFVDSTLSVLIARIVDEAFSQAEPRWPPDVLSSYLAWVGRFQGSGAASSGGMLVHVDHSGIVRYAAVHDMRELRLEQSLYIQEHQRRLDDIALQQERAFQRQREHERDRGMSL